MSALSTVCCLVPLNSPQCTAWKTLVFLAIVLFVYNNYTNVSHYCGSLFQLKQVDETPPGTFCHWIHSHLAHKAT